MGNSRRIVVDCSSIIGRAIIRDRRGRASSSVGEELAKGEESFIGYATYCSFLILFGLDSIKDTLTCLSRSLKVGAEPEELYRN
jgi:hypothetical protein